jgi:RNA polymerase sporulation-specific sigma factor
MSDDELWLSASCGSIVAEEVLLQRYSRLVRVCARPYFLSGGDSEDLIQEGMLGLLSAVRHYDVARTTKFRTYAELCIRNRILSAIRNASRSKHIPLNDYVPLESPQFEEGNSAAAYYLQDPEELLLAREGCSEINSKLRSCLSHLEQSVLQQYLQGRSYKEIAASLNRTEKSVDNAVQRIRKKLSQKLNNGEYSES